MQRAYFLIWSQCTFNRALKLCESCLNCRRSILYRSFVKWKRWIHINRCSTLSVMSRWLIAIDLNQLLFCFQNVLFSKNLVQIEVQGQVQSIKNSLTLIVTIVTNLQEALRFRSRMPAFFAQQIYDVFISSKLLIGLISLHFIHGAITWMFLLQGSLQLLPIHHAKLFPSFYSQLRFLSLFLRL